MTDPLLEQTFIRAADNLIFRADLGGEVALFHPVSKQYYGLDAVGAVIWKLLEQPRTFCQLRDVVLAKYEVESECCERDLLTFLQELGAAGLVEISNGTRQQGPMLEPAA